jgi:toxin ParE1/3/4
VVLSENARRDIVNVLRWSESNFGESAAARYRALLLQALRDIAEDPERPGSSARPELKPGIRSYHLRSSRSRVAATSGIVRRPRHFLLYRQRPENMIEVVRVLHDARDLRGHLD